MFLEAEQFVPVSWMCKKQTSVSHSSTESEIISLDAGLRMDGLPAPDLWDIAIELRRTTKDNFQPGHTGSGKLGQIQPTIPAQGNLSMFNPTRQLVIPKPRPNVSIENKELIN